MSNSGKFRSFLKGERAVSASAPPLILAIFFLLLLSRLMYVFAPTFDEADGQYLTTALLQLVIFPIPTYIYFRIRGKEGTATLRSRISPRRARLSHLFLIISAVMILIAGCTLLAMLCGMMKSQSSFTLYGTFRSSYDGTAVGALRLILAYGILPAVCEEVVFRGIVCAEYEQHGILYSSLISALFFAFLHFDVFAFPVYLFSGLVLAFVMYTTRSVISCIAVHLGYNLFGIFVQAGLSGYCNSTGSVGLLVIVLVAILLLGAAFFCGEVARIMRGRAKPSLMDDPSVISTPGINKLNGREWGAAIVGAFNCLPAVLCLVIWLAAATVNIITTFF
ncbi:MAG: CPBP family intramembrane metalloprotease [Ruminococcaceae bacterium]|nr:CPBP family intramembrane metalloprotease [Oscillospiraceae bacterium]